MFFSSKPAPTPPAAADIAETPTSMDSDSMKKAVIRQIQQESNTANARQLIEVCDELPVHCCTAVKGLSLHAENGLSLLREMRAQTRLIDF